MSEIKLQTVISTILITLIIVITGYGLLSINYSAAKFKKTPTEIHQQLIKDEYLINIDSLNLKDSISEFILIDLRSQNDFEKGHFDNAIHLFSPRILESESIESLKNYAKENKTIVLYSHSPQEAMGSWYLLTSIGIENIKILNVTTSFINNEFIVTPFNSEILKNDIANFIIQRNEIKEEPIAQKPIQKKLPVVKPVKKEKIEIEEGGC